MKLPNRHIKTSLYIKHLGFQRKTQIHSILNTAFKKKILGNTIFHLKFTKFHYIHDFISSSKQSPELGRTGIINNELHFTGEGTEVHKVLGLHKSFIRATYRNQILCSKELEQVIFYILFILISCLHAKMC